MLSHVIRPLLLSAVAIFTSLLLPAAASAQDEEAALDDLYYELSELVEQQQPQAVLDLLDNSSIDISGNSYMQMERACALFELGRLDEARPLLLEYHLAQHDNLYVAMLLLELSEFSVLDTAFAAEEYADNGSWRLQQRYAQPEDLAALPALLAEARQAAPDSTIPWLIEAVLTDESTLTDAHRNLRREVMLASPVDNIALLADFCMEDEAYESTLELCREGLLLHPDSYWLLDTLERCRDYMGRPDLLHDDLAQIAAVGRASSYLYYILGQSHESRGEPEEALAAFRQAHLAEPDGGFLEDVGRLLNTLGRPQELIDLAAALEQPEEYAPFYLELGRAHAALGNHDAALESYLLAYEDPEYGPMGGIDIARSLAGLERHSEALEYIYESYEYYSDLHPEVLLLAADCLLATGDTESALREAYDATLIDPSDSATLRNYADLRAEHAGDDISVNEDLWRWDYEQRSSLGDAMLDHIERGDNDLAMEMILASRGRYPDNPVIAVMYAAMLADQGNPQSALDVVQSALDELPAGHADIREMLDITRLSFSIGILDISEIQQQAQKYIEVDEPGDSALTLAYEIQAELGNYDEALDIARRVLEIIPDDFETLLAIAAYSNEAWRSAEGIEPALRAIELQPTNPRAHLVYMYCAIDSGNTDEMFAYFRNFPEWQHSYNSSLVAEYAVLLDEQGRETADAWLREQHTAAGEELDQEKLLPLNLLLQRDIRARTEFEHDPAAETDLAYIMSPQEMQELADAYGSLGEGGLDYKPTEADFETWQALAQKYPDSPVVLLNFSGVCNNMGRQHDGNEAMATMYAKYPALLDEITKGVSASSGRTELAAVVLEIFAHYIAAAVDAYPDDATMLNAAGRCYISLAMRDRAEAMLERMQDQKMETAAISDLQQRLQD